MNANPVTIDNLQRGLRQLFAYRTAKGKSGEGEWDFNNSLYTELQGYRSGGCSKDFWEFLVDELWAWRAIRPMSKQQIHAAGIARLHELQMCLSKLVSDSIEDSPTIDQIEWGDVSSLFSVAQDIKPVAGDGKSMFASKLCHFLVPSCYVITDATLVKQGWDDYRHYWEECRDAWIRSPDKERLQVMLRKCMPHGTVTCKTYPWATKIVELCQFDVK